MEAIIDIAQVKSSELGGCNSGAVALPEKIIPTILLRKTNFVAIFCIATLADPREQA